MKPAGCSADLSLVESIAWTIITVIIAGAGLALLHGLALALKGASHLHDLKVHVATLRISYLADLQRHHNENTKDVYVIDREDGKTE